MVYKIDFMIRHSYRETKYCKDGRMRNVACNKFLKRCKLPKNIMTLEGFKEWWVRRDIIGNNGANLWFGNTYYGIGRFSLVNRSRKGYWHRVARFEVKVKDKKVVFIGDFHRLEIALGYRRRKAEKQKQFFNGLEPKPKTKPKKKVRRRSTPFIEPGGVVEYEVPEYYVIEDDYDDYEEDEW